MGLSERARHLPEQLSGGERQRVTIARALVNDPAIVWADEPTGDLDSENAEEITALLRRLNVERGLTLLIVTHDISVGRATDRIVHMVDGEVVGADRGRSKPSPGGSDVQRLFGIPMGGLALGSRSASGSPRHGGHRRAAQPRAAAARLRNVSRRRAARC